MGATMWDINNYYLAINLGQNANCVYNLVSSHSPPNCEICQPVIGFEV